MPLSFKELVNLKRLDLSFNKLNALIDLSQEQKQGQPLWPHLRHINLNNNQLTSLPPYLFECKNLCDLFFSDNPITIIPPEIANLKELLLLEANSASLMEIPQELSLLPKLYGIYLCNNQVKVIPSWIKDIASLQNFYVDGCPVV